MSKRKPSGRRATTNPTHRHRDAEITQIDYSVPKDGGSRTTSRGFSVVDGVTETWGDTFDGTVFPPMRQVVTSEPVIHPRPTEGAKARSVKVSDTPDPRPNPIPTDRRTRPLRLSEAARFMGYPGKPKAKGKALRAAINDGAIKCFKLTRQSYIFDIRDFPQERLSNIRPAT